MKQKVNNTPVVFKGKVTLYHPHGRIITEEPITFPVSMRAKNDYWQGSFGVDTEAVLTDINQRQFNNNTVSEVNRVARALKRVENITGAKMTQNIWDALIQIPKLYVHYMDEHKRHVNVSRLVSVLNKMEPRGNCYCFFIDNGQYPRYNVTCKAVNGLLVVPSFEDIKAIF